MRKDLRDCVKLIRDKTIRAFVEDALMRTSPRFWKDPCSSTGANHPPEDQVEGGIIVHTRKAVRVALDLFRFYGINDKLIQDRIVAAVILHDSMKNGAHWSDRTDYTHGKIVRDVLGELKVGGERARDHKDVGEVLKLVENHMGIWNSPESTPALVRGKTISNRTVAHEIVQLSDYWASRKWCPFVADEMDSVS